MALSRAEMKQVGGRSRYQGVVKVVANDAQVDVKWNFACHGSSDGQLP